MKGLDPSPFRIPPLLSAFLGLFLVNPCLAQQGKTATQRFSAQAGPYQFVLERAPSASPKSEPGGLTLLVFKPGTGIVYHGPLTLEWLDDGKVLHTGEHEAANEESLYAVAMPVTKDPSNGEALRVTLALDHEIVGIIPLTAPGPKPHAGPWIGAALALFLVILFVTARRGARHD